mmetsp:Transcript_15617/g.34124  ORF Transcript_15617/g.34124 Transcript_15617/m.34124 type:complete len:121 (-) Transcript_15617:105-467(-)
MLFLEPSMVESSVLKAAGFTNNSDNPMTFKLDAKNAKSITELVDSVIQMMGPDIDFVQNILFNLGARFLRIGGEAQILPNVGLALCMAMELSLKRDMTAEEKDAFDEIYDCFSSEIAKAL